MGEAVEDRRHAKDGKPMVPLAAWRRFIRSLEWWSILIAVPRLGASFAFSNLCIPPPVRKS